MSTGGSNARQYMLWAFKLSGCRDCGFRPESVEDLKRMECDHRDPSTKSRYEQSGLLKTPGSLSQVARHSNAALLEELWKCDPVCADCHHVRTRERARTRPPAPTAEIAAWLAEPLPEMWSGEPVSLFEDDG